MTGEGGRGRKVWEDSDRLHADLQRKPQKERLPGESEKENTEKQKVREIVRCICETQAGQNMRQQPVSHANIARRNMSGVILFLVFSPIVMFGNCMERTGAKFRLHKLKNSQHCAELIFTLQEVIYKLIEPERNKNLCISLYITYKVVLILQPRLSVILST